MYWTVEVSCVLVFEVFVAVHTYHLILQILHTL